ncbi:MAG: FAD-binding oxidoreductase [Burkholderiales bacterium]|nr:FAD-binding oxidoreductase [Burkholderiales bacterium]
MEPTPAPLPAKVDVLVVGGGYAGLATAHELAQGGAQVAVCEAAPFGHFASARNSGGVSFGLELETLRHYRKWLGLKGSDAAALAAEAAQAVDELAGFIEAERIDCDFRMAGRLVAATSERRFRQFEARVASLNRLFDARAYLVERRDQGSEIDGPNFHGLMVISRSGQLHPAKLLHGLLRCCRLAGVSLHARTQVLSLQRQGAAFSAQTSRGPIECERIVLATNAHLHRLGEIGLERRVVPVVSNIVVTQELDQGLIDRLLPRRRTASDGRRVLAYFRVTPDGRRFLYGSRAAPGEISTERATAILRARMVRSFPQLSNARIDYAWGCQVAFTLDRIPHLGESAGIHFITGCHGNGVAMMNHLGRKTARRILSGERSAFDANDFPRIPLYRGTPWFLPSMHRAYQFIDWKSER